ncbi:MAG: exodeoxyribonuclease V subunit beta [Zoogloeaceae bacterium]|nr:exodeoxyribonuclease V subunit beta [Zoogloeaceae bacterium]MCP5238683.1 exodeoxyribonuclease V subunit beta [Zoogloeaceae bacterium]MCP5254386.1 exodeoxyribonuclease V subunit beta [Zoogloeaceae bacterium]
MRAGQREQVVALDALGFPLNGSRLIEASAGTGKTFTIAALYVRLVLGHGGESAFGRPLVPPEILVVTFTEAATKELRDRIRRRLAQAAEVFQSDPCAVPETDEFLAALSNAYPFEAWPGCARKLQLAAEWMDEAAVSTIHGWCNRMLREHAFDSASLFSQKLETDQSELFAEVVRDYWRIFYAGLPVAGALEVSKWWNGPEALQKAIDGLTQHAGALAVADEPAALLAETLHARAARLAELKAGWDRWANELEALFDAAVTAKQVDGRKLQARYYRPWFAALRDWAGDASLISPALSASAWARLGAQGIEEAFKGKPPAHPAMSALTGLAEALAALPDCRIELVRHAARWVAARFEQETRRRAEMGFNDLLTRLDAVLAGPNGERLAERIRDQFPVALIDEFQDTDPVQYRIFEAIYRVRENRADTALVLIGDPKQAIYAFRGADIHTYLAARRDCAGRLYTLKRNYRSSHAMVAAVNRVFGLAEARAAGEGAFLFRRGEENPVPFIEVEAEGCRDSLLIGGAQQAALTVWHLPAVADKPLSKGAYRTGMAAVCAGEMVRLLNAGQSGEAGFVAEDGRFEPLRPRDLAVLVAGRTEADAIREALAARGVRSVYLSDRDSVFATAAAEALIHWLAACAEPDDPRLLRAALATALLGLRWRELEALNRDELAWEARVMQFRAYREIWRKQGVLPMLRRLMNDFGLPARLLAAATGPGGGERVLTDLLHLAELLQQAAAQLDGEHALIRYLAEQCADPASGNGEARQIRLESDADLVQVVTVHKSKGLEYPLVFLPFAAAFRPLEASDCPIALQLEDGRRELLLSADERQLALADRERLGEDLRKFYVALTRARYATWLGLAPLKGLAASAPGYLLGGGEEIGAAELAARLATLADARASIVVGEAPAASSVPYAPRDGAGGPGMARMPQRAVREHWWIASYSALRRAGSEQPREAPETAREDTFREDLHRQPPLVVPPSSTGLHGFPRGAEVGTFLHDLLEWAAGTGFAALAARPAWLRDTVARRCARRGWDAWIEPLAEWMTDFIGREFALPDADVRFSLAGLTGVVAEMEFWIAAGNVDTLALDRLVCAHTLGGAARPPLAADRLNGMLKGFIDLLLEHEGRYYVVDYKSNWLGPDDAAYNCEAMRQAVLEARYELQYVLYLLALHRLLRVRLPGYDYEHHIGGAVYLFLRGSGSLRQGVHFERPPRLLIEALDALFAGQAVEGEAA